MRYLNKNVIHLRFNEFRVFTSIALYLNNTKRAAPPKQQQQQQQKKEMQIITN